MLLLGLTEAKLPTRTLNFAQTTMPSIYHITSFSALMCTQIHAIQRIPKNHFHRLGNIFTFVKNFNRSKLTTAPKHQLRNHNGLEQCIGKLLWRCRRAVNWERQRCFETPTILLSGCGNSITTCTGHVHSLRIGSAVARCSREDETR